MLETITLTRGYYDQLQEDYKTMRDQMRFFRDESSQNKFKTIRRDGILKYYKDSLDKVVSDLKEIAKDGDTLRMKYDIQIAIVELESALRFHSSRLHDEVKEELENSFT